MEMQKLTLKEWLMLAGLFIAGYIFTITQKYYLPSPVRPFTFLAAILIVYLLSFYLLKPKKPTALANTLAVTFGVIVLLIILIQDILIMHYFSWRTLIVFFGTVLVPYMSAWVYRALLRKGSGNRCGK